MAVLASFALRQSAAAEKEREFALKAEQRAELARADAENAAAVATEQKALAFEQTAIARQQTKLAALANLSAASAISPDGVRMLLIKPEGDLSVISLATGKEIGNIAEHGITAAAFSPDAKRVATGASDGEITLWDSLTTTPIGASLAGHSSAVRRIAFSPDAQLIASGSDDATARVWSTSAGNLIGAPILADSPVVGVAFSPDGERLIITSQRAAFTFTTRRSSRLFTKGARHSNRRCFPYLSWSSAQISGVSHKGTARKSVRSVARCLVIVDFDRFGDIFDARVSEHHDGVPKRSWTDSLDWSWNRNQRPLRYCSESQLWAVSAPTGFGLVRRLSHPFPPFGQRSLSART